MGESVKLPEPKSQAGNHSAHLHSARRVVVLSTHLDDGVMSLGATLAGLSSAGVPAEVVTILAGDPDSRAPAGPWDRRAGFATAGEAASVRREEDRRACSILGVGTTWLPFDGVQYGLPVDEDAAWRAILGAAEGADVVLVPGWPLSHPDHMWLARLVLSRVSLGVRMGLYAEQPDTSRRAGEPEIAPILLPYVERNEGTARPPASARDRRRKWRACRAYRSQLPPLEQSYGHRLRSVAEYESKWGGETIIWVRALSEDCERHTDAEGSQARKRRPVVAPLPAVSIEPGPRPTFSIVISTYQLADVVTEAVESALAQTVPPLEVIVCDDGSTDDTEAALAPYRDRIVYMRKENGGLSSARNAGARIASGDFLAFLDADDAYLPEFLEALGDLAGQRPDLDILTTDAYFEMDGIPIRNYLFNGFVTEKQRKGILRDVRLWICSSAIRRERFFSVGGMDESIPVSEDWDFFIRMFLRGARAGLVAEPLALYRQRPGSLSDNVVRVHRAAVSVLSRYADRTDLDPEERRQLHRSLSSSRSRLRLAEAEGALRRRAPDARRLSLAIALDQDIDPRSRAKAGLAAVAPRVAATFITRREQRLGRSRFQRWIPMKG
jgi:LmbE family N-acetylglucosaminyl deacetylase/GT2 family glycosyltransferase